MITFGIILFILFSRGHGSNLSLLRGQMLNLGQDELLGSDREVVQRAPAIEPGLLVNVGFLGGLVPTVELKLA